MNIFKNLLFFLLSGLSLPALDQTLIDSLNDFFDLIFANAGVLGFFVRPSTLHLLIPVLIAIVVFDKAYFLIIWILKKIPFIRYGIGVFMGNVINYKALRLIDIGNQYINNLLNERSLLINKVPYCKDRISEIDSKINYHLKAQQLIMKFYY